MNDTVRVLLVLGGTPVLCAVVLLVALALPDPVGRPISEAAGVGTILGLFAVMTVAVVVGVTGLARFLQQRLRPRGRNWNEQDQ